MAGFPKYPIPRYLNSYLWLLNKNWKMNLFHTFVPTVLFAVIMCRTLSLNFVKFYINILENLKEFPNFLVSNSAARILYRS